MRSLTIVISFALLAIIANIAAPGERNREENTAFAESELWNLRHDLDIWKHLVSQGSDDDVLKKKVAQSVLTKVLVIRALDPDVNFLRGQALETLCVLTEPDSRRILDEAGVPQLAVLAGDYLAEVAGPTKARISTIQRAMRGKGCFLSPKSHAR